MHNNLKDYKQKEIQYFIIANLLVIFTFSTRIDSILYINNYRSLINLAPLIGGMGIIYVYFIILDSVISTNIKNLLVFLGNSRLPGNTIFNKLYSKKYKDFRISIEKLQLFYKDTWNEINEDGNITQNNKFYSFYKNVKNDDLIFYSNKNYLLMRDMNVISFLFMIFYPFIFLLIHFVFYNGWVQMFFVILWVMTLYASHSTGYKFAKNVLISNYYNKEMDDN
ncbi:hypothetical protein WR164_01840 [Philodulcilactobacillus myokoensis]|uniref:Uncharacterized protein n=1 Tax=Philodulcilactobacillus myokoensis TaxID=2929573 RepID=A0A9W6ERN6_9LACO|nr:hypothetical protein [Philodulcilactobacillus myokoensis]GLB46205.1 hypothetical protein WR164_01840 [Philodulcilactobacillus myokoensis]